MQFKETAERQGLMKTNDFEKEIKNSEKCLTSWVADCLIEAIG